MGRCLHNLFTASARRCSVRCRVRSRSSRVGRDGRTAAVLYSLTGTCKHYDIDPFAYLRDVLRRLPTHPADQLDELLVRLCEVRHGPRRRWKRKRFV
ncbi:MAG: transposase domain-containing protein [Singulisphaera sp.]|nr:transposase domain-containing protein [Singulisphaera sp.]